jgi:hypothetical protein
MPCDERYRAWAMRQSPGHEDRPMDLLWASVTGARPCPARAGFRELRFDVDGLAWSWCFPQPDAHDGRLVRSEVRVVVLRPGAHGLAAEAVIAEEDGSRQVAKLDCATAAELALSGMPVFVHHSLVPAHCA